MGKIYTYHCPNNSETTRIIDNNKDGDQKQRRCWLCNEYKDLDQFSKDNGRKGGLMNRCKDCDRAYLEFKMRRKYAK